ncbi:fused MFS/spermidine synthase [Roseateles sp.]|uniref:fused MFS/spermidine synthase n=1 Tax=Roseateles sp. TaxID=1971397 RepID=UPI003BA3E2E2
MTDLTAHAKPFVYETGTSRALHFTLSEIQSRMQTERPRALDLDYTRLMMGFLLFHAAPARLAMIGLGGGSMAKFCHHFMPSTRIEVVEINPHVIALREAFCIPPDDTRFQVQLADGAAYLSAAPEPIDVLVVDGFDGSGQPEALCSQRFYDDSQAALQPDGLLVVNLHTAHPDFELHAARIARSFAGEVLRVPDRDGSNTIVFAAKAPLAQRFKPQGLRQFDAQTRADLMPAWAAVERAVRGMQVDAEAAP